MSIVARRREMMARRHCSSVVGQFISLNQVIRSQTERSEIESNRRFNGPGSRSRVRIDVMLEDAQRTRRRSSVGLRRNDSIVSRGRGKCDCSVDDNLLVEVCGNDPDRIGQRREDEAANLATQWLEEEFFAYQ